ncbi:MAG: septal ring lytic transglycosylase RlpA family protein [Acidobacteriota bacterium]
MRTLLMGCAVTALTVVAAQSEGTPAKVRKIKMPKPPPFAIPKSQVGVASWYGSYFQGLPTASGQPFDMNAMTCAHRHLPLGTRIKVTNLVNFRSLVLKVNDRGPAVDGRILDVSRAAARRLGFMGAGLTLVRIQVVSPPPHRLISESGPAVIASTAD